MIEGPPLTLPDDMVWVGDYPSEGARLSPGHPAIIAPEKNVQLTFAEFEEQVARASGFIAGRGLGAGDRLAWLGTNSDLFYIVFFAAIRLGVIVVPINWRCAAPEISYFISDSGARLLLCDPEFLSVAGQATTNLAAQPDVIATEQVPGSDAGLRQLLAQTDPMQVPTPHDDAVCVQLYTSGTTGKPKGTLCTHRALTVSRYCEVQMPDFPDWEGGTVVSAMPHFHIGGLSWMTMALKRRSTCVITADPSPGNIVRLLKEYGASSTFSVATVIRGIIQELKRTSEQLPQLDTIFYGASPIGESLLRDAMETLGCRFGQFFGMTEATGSLTFLAPRYHDLERPELMSSVGRVLPGMALDIRDPQGRSLAPGEHGEIWAQTPALMAGYWGREDATAEAVVDGWYRTGDGARFDADGFLYLTDRIKDMIVSGGENIYPNEVEEVLRAHPSVSDVAVVGTPDERWGEAVTAIVEIVPGAQLVPAELREFARQRIAAYKCPKEIEIRETLPRTASGKIQRAKARAELLDNT